MSQVRGFPTLHKVFVNYFRNDLEIYGIREILEQKISLSVQRAPRLQKNHLQETPF